MFVVVLCQLYILFSGEWSYEPKLEEKSSTGYIGLQNLGCICYMNAPLQQLYMIPELRKNILSITEYKDIQPDDDIKESLIYQLQLMFATLQESEEQSYNPASFCYSFKDFDGKPTDVRVQVMKITITYPLCDNLQIII